MINVSALDMYSDAHPLHPQVLIKIKEQALGGFLSDGLQIVNSNTSDDYFDDCAALYDFLFEKEAENLDDGEFEKLWFEFTGNEPTKWCLYEGTPWSDIWIMIVEDFDRLKSTVEHCIALQALGSVAEYIDECK